MDEAALVFPPALTRTGPGLRSSHCAFQIAAHFLLQRSTPTPSPSDANGPWGTLNSKPLLLSFSSAGNASVMTFYFDKTLTAENINSLRRKSSTDEASNIPGLAGGKQFGSAS